MTAGTRSSLARRVAVPGGLASRCRAAPVYRVVMSVSGMVDQGMRVVFEKTGDKDLSRGGGHG